MLRDMVWTFCCRIVRSLGASHRMTLWRGPMASDRSQTLHIKGFGQRPLWAGIGANFSIVSLANERHIATHVREYEMSLRLCTNTSSCSWRTAEGGLIPPLVDCDPFVMAGHAVAHLS